MASAISGGIPGGRFLFGVLLCLSLSSYALLLSCYLPAELSPVPEFAPAALGFYDFELVVGLPLVLESNAALDDPLVAKLYNLN